MQDIVELISLTDVERLESEGLWSFLLEPGSKMEQLCLAIYRQEVKTDEQACLFLYHTPKPGNKYYNLKERLKERLTFAITLLDSKKKSFSNRQSAFFECNRKWSASMVLLSKHSRTAAISQLESLLNQTIYYEFTELTVSSASMLRVFYGTVNGDQEKYLKYNSIHEHYQQVWWYENQVETVYADLMRHYIGTNSQNPNLKQKAQTAFEKVMPLMDICDSFKVQLMGRLIELKIYEGDYRATAALCEAAISFFQTKPYDSRLPLQAFYYNLIDACIHLREFERGRDNINALQAVTEVGTFNWLKLQELFFQLAMHTTNYNTALDIVAKVKKQLRSEWLPEKTVEIWKIHEAYVYYLGLLGKITNVKTLGQIGFKPGKFLNEIPNYSRDKQGMNIPILIIQILIMLARKDHPAIHERVDAIDKYRSRYLKKGNATSRSNYFIKMLVQIPASQFHQEAVVRNTQKLLLKLPASSGVGHEIEIIPYESLWAMVLDTLDKKIIRERSPRPRTAPRGGKNDLYMP